MRPLLLLLALASPLSAEPVHTAATLTGVATRAIDGDGVMFDQLQVRLRAIAAPEDRRGARTLEGRHATAALDLLVRGKLVVCHLDGSTASFGRAVGTCFAEGQDLGARMIALGLARACPAYGPEYVDDEARAVAAGLNLGAVYALPAYCLTP